MTTQERIEQYALLTARQAILSTAHHDFAKGLNRHALYKTDDSNIGENLVQDTFMKTWKFLLKGGKIETMKAFLYHILNHLIIDEYRKRKSTSLDTLIESGFEPSDDDGGRLINYLDGKAASLLILRLPEKYREVMRMRYMQDLSLAQMALVTGRTKNALAVQVHRGIEKLQELYANRA